MPELVTLELPEELARHARAVAAQTHQRVEDVLIGWIRSGGAEPAVDLLPDEELLAVCDSQLPADQQQELSELLERNREGQLQPDDSQRLDSLMRAYRRGLIRKAQALKVAVARGLRLPLN
jgi:hypothetical protein